MDIINDIIAPPNVPSQVLFGDILSNSFVLPKNIPVKYANVSFSQIAMKIVIKYNG